MMFANLRSTPTYKKFSEYLQLDFLQRNLFAPHYQLLMEASRELRTRFQDPNVHNFYRIFASNPLSKFVFKLP